MSMKNPLTPGGIEPATFRFVAQHLNLCATADFGVLVKEKLSKFEPDFENECVPHSVLASGVVLYCVLYCIVLYSELYVIFLSS